MFATKRHSAPFASRIALMKEAKSEMEDVFGECISAYTLSQAIEDGILVDVTDMEREAGFKWPVAMMRTVYERYVEVPPELIGKQDIQGRLWDVVWMMWVNIRPGKVNGSYGEFTLLVRVPESAEWQSNETVHAEDPGLRRVTLKSVSGPGDNGKPVITLMLPFED